MIMNARHNKYLIGIVSLSRTHQNSITLLFDLDLEREFRKKALCHLIWMYPILILKNVLYLLDKELNGTEIVFRGDMELTIGQIIGARNGTRFSKKWPEGKVPYTFHESLLEQERNVLEKIFKRFNKDLKGCLRVRYIFIVQL